MKTLADGVLALLLSSAIAASQVCPPPAPAAPVAAAGQLTANAPTFDMGEVLRGETVSHTFTLTNSGTTDVTIFEVRACCTCATAAVTIGGKSRTAAETAACKLLGTLKPREQADVTVTVDTLDPGCGSKDGPMSKSVNVYRSDATSNPIALSITGMLVTPYTVEPGWLDLGRVRQGQTSKTSCVLSGGKLCEFKVIRASVADESLVKVTFEKLPGERDAPSSYRIDAELLPSATVGSHQSHVDLEIDHARVKAISIPVRVTVEAIPPRR